MISKLSNKQLSIAIGAITLFSLIMLYIVLWATSRGPKEYKPSETNTDTLEYRQHFHSKLPQDGLMEALIYYDVKYPHIVYAQALIETGNFKSDLCLSDNNLFGLYNSSRNKYHRFDHWTESVIAYKDFIQRRYKPPEDYYEFLQRIGYAEDPNYISKLKKVVNKNDTRRSE